MKITDLKFEVSGTTVYALEFNSWYKGVEQMRNRVYANVQGYHQTPKEEIEAVAKLFAAAPELLEALQLTTAVLEGLGMQGAVNSAKAAITKALGE